MSLIELAFLYLISLRCEGNIAALRKEVHEAEDQIVQKWDVINSLLSGPKAGLVNLLIAFASAAITPAVVQLSRSVMFSTTAFGETHKYL